VGSGSELETL